MQKITILGFLAMIAVSSASLVCEPGSLCGLRRSQSLNDASDRNEMAPSRPLDVPLIITMEEAESTSTKSQDVPLVPAAKVESRVRRTVSSTHSKPPVPTGKISTPENSIPSLVQKYQPHDVSSQVRTPVPTAKDTSQVTSAQQLPSTPAEQTHNGRAAPLTPQNPRTEASGRKLVLSLDVKKESSPWSKSEKKYGNIDCSIICDDGSVVKAHKDIVVEHSPYLGNNIHKVYSVKLDYPPNIIKSIVDLMYGQHVTINKEDFGQITKAAKFLGMEKLNVL